MADAPPLGVSSYMGPTDIPSPTPPCAPPVRPLDGKRDVPKARVKPATREPALAFCQDAPLVEISKLLELAQSGDLDAQSRVLDSLYQELHGIARRQMRGQPADHTLQPTALLNEAWMRISPGQRGYADRGHFLATAARAMRCVLVDHARRRETIKRKEPGERIALDRVVLCYESNALDLAALDEALRELATFDETMAQAVELRFFGGLEMDEIAAYLGVTKRTLERRWTATRSWLKSRVQ